ncbi:hypothetical protein SAMN04487895_101674 [Paenibacillus sophorae]|uniref:Uncharacterized protein n=1 Tax=Paenibacillus sophorae TaxID=1333845 RepID=A0A1H8GYD8_9BACL|nr:hypothetical protein [Paenibacillus sophorae]QWU14368.1 hypothetical protein KP014_20900 [Paenibacillus sophorae]SEN48517.1 hypothetical protein SAMN04487895_101674 [Paenibacillus sophorae]
MKTIGQMMTELTDEQIEAAFHENEEWRKTGVLQEGILRSTYDRFCEINGGVTYMIHLITEPLLYEMVKRYRARLLK